MQTERLEPPVPNELAGPRELIQLQAAALEAAANPILISKRDGTIVWANKAFEELSGYTREEALGQSTSLLKTERQSPSFYKKMWETILSGKQWRGELVNRRKDGSCYEEEMTITPVKDAAGEVSHFIAIKLDITERKRAEERICRLAQAVENSAELIALADPDGRISFANQALLQATGYQESEILGELFGNTLISRNNPPTLGEEIRVRTISGGVWRGECLGRRKDDSDFPVFLSTGPIKDSQGQVIGIFGIGQDSAPIASVLRNSCSSPRRWKRWDGLPAEWPTISTISWASSWATATWFWTVFPWTTRDASSWNKSRKQACARRR